MSRAVFQVTGPGNSRGTLLWKESASSRGNRKASVAGAVIRAQPLQGLWAGLRVWNVIQGKWELWEAREGEEM